MDVIKNKLGNSCHSEPVYEYRYLKAKVREFDGAIKTNFLGNDVPKKKNALYLHCLHNYWFCFENVFFEIAVLYIHFLPNSDSKFMF